MDPRSGSNVQVFQSRMKDSSPGSGTRSVVLDQNRSASGFRTGTNQFSVDLKLLQDPDQRFWITFCLLVDIKPRGPRRGGETGVFMRPNGSRFRRPRCRLATLWAGAATSPSPTCPAGSWFWSRLGAPGAEPDCCLPPLSCKQTNKQETVRFISSR